MHRFSPNRNPPLRPTHKTRTIGMGGGTFSDETSAPTNDWPGRQLLNAARACGMSALAGNFSTGLHRFAVGAAVANVRGGIAITSRMFAAFRSIGHEKSFLAWSGCRSSEQQPLGCEFLLMLT